MSANANVALIQAYTQGRASSGWKEEEEALLWEEVRRAREEGRALKSVFDGVAERTGRKPNSIRNYYYARAKENPEQIHHPAFVPFTQEEIWDLLVTVLSEQAKGVSVRACTLKMGEGDTRAMLRYQNKYRALVKNNPPLVREVIRYMRENGMPCADPYECEQTRKAGRPRKEREAEGGRSALAQEVENLLRIAGEVEELKRQVDTLEQVVMELQGLQAQPMNMNGVLA